MRTVSSLAVLFSFMLVAAGADKSEGDLPKDKWDTAYLENQWGLTLKSVKCTGKGSGKFANMTEFELLVEFNKDISDVAALAQSLGNGVVNQFKLCAFDADNVLIGTTTFFELSAGEVSGKQGDAFRIKVRISPEVVAKAAKVQIRAPNGSPKGSGSSK